VVEGSKRWEAYMEKHAAGQNSNYLGSMDKVKGWVVGIKRESRPWSHGIQTYEE